MWFGARQLRVPRHIVRISLVYCKISLNMDIMRRKSVQKCTIIFFSLLLVVIWVNHVSQGGSQAGPKEVAVEYFPPVEAYTDQELTPHPNRATCQVDQVNRLHERLLRDDSGQKLSQSDDGLDYDNDNDDDEDEDEDEDPFMSDIKRRKWKSMPPSRFFVSSSKCKMPSPDPFSKEALAILKPGRWKNCSNDRHIFALKFDEKLLQYRLQVNTTLLGEMKPGVPTFSCNYREVANNTRTPWKSFHQEAVIDLSPSGIVAECHGALSTSRIMQQDAFPLVQLPPQRARVEPSPSVIMLGLDSLSRMNFRRTMPKTAQFVKQEGWFEMEGYNKVGDSALSNLCAIFAGAKSDTSCTKLFPELWQAYKRAGYTTAFGEDTLDTSVPPELRTDYQLRALLEDISRSMSSVQRPGFENCMGRRLSFSYLYDFGIQFAQRLIEELDQPAFGLFWSSNFTRDHDMGGTALDDKFVEYLELMRGHRVFERAIVILFSDQGQTSGDLVELADGFLEERLPMLHIYLPPWFRETYPMFAQNLIHNRNRLTSPLDLHNTLRHILNLKALAPKEMTTLAKCRNSQSLMHLIPQSRSCEEACIGMHWCACNEFVLVPNDANSYYLAKVFVYHINAWMLKNHHNRFCQRLSLSAVDYVERNLADEQSSTGGIIMYRLRIRTYPEGVFESTVRFNTELRKMVDINVKEISSKNHSNRGDCVKDRTAKKFCFCYPKIKDEEMKTWTRQK